jgi:uncharacterized protein with HEPN domain
MRFCAKPGSCMTLHSDEVSLRQMLEHSREALALVHGRTREDLDRDRVLCLALVQLVQIVEEAAGRVSSATRARYCLVPWREIIGLRNRLVHGYDAIDYDILWRVLTEDLARLIPVLEKGPPPET